MSVGGALVSVLCLVFVLDVGEAVILRDRDYYVLWPAPSDFEVMKRDPRSGATASTSASSSASSSPWSGRKRGADFSPWVGKRSAGVPRVPEASTPSSDFLPWAGRKRSYDPSLDNYNWDRLKRGSRNIDDSSPIDVVETSSGVVPDRLLTNNYVKKYNWDRLRKRAYGWSWRRL